MLPNTKASISDCPDIFVRTILVVEDEELIRVVLTEFLQDHGYHVIEAENVAQAKDLLCRNAVDVIFSDVNMPGGENGFALEKWVRRHFPNIGILLTSGLPQETKDTKDLVEPLIPKPYPISLVVERIESLLSRRHEVTTASTYAVA